MKMTPARLRKIIKEEMAIIEGLGDTGPTSTFRGIIELCEKALSDRSIAYHPEAAKMYRDKIESMLRNMSDVETIPYKG